MLKTEIGQDKQAGHMQILDVVRDGAGNGAEGLAGRQNLLWVTSAKDAAQITRTGRHAGRVDDSAFDNELILLSRSRSWRCDNLKRDYRIPSLCGRRSTKYLLGYGHELPAPQR